MYAEYSNAEHYLSGVLPWMPGPPFEMLLRIQINGRLLPAIGLIIYAQPYLFELYHMRRGMSTVLNMQQRYILLVKRMAEI